VRALRWPPGRVIADTIWRSCARCGRVVVAGLVHARDLPPRLERGRDRLRELLHVGEIGGQRASVAFDFSYRSPASSSASRRSSASSDSSRRARTPRPRRRGCPPRASRTRSAWSPRGSARARDRPCGSVQHGRRGGPVLEPHQRRARVVLGRGPDARVGRGLRDAQEVIGRARGSPAPRSPARPACRSRRRGCRHALALLVVAGVISSTRV
jgi:hypothetical protein